MATEHKMSRLQLTACRREQNVPVFTKASDWIIFILAVIGAVVGIFWLATGYITI